jgi:CheY-like chemotaxis protein
MHHSFQMKSGRRVRKLTGNLSARHCSHSRPGRTTSTRPIFTQCMEQAYENLPTDHFVRSAVDYSVAGGRLLSREGWRPAGSAPERRSKRPLSRCDRPGGNQMSDIVIYEDNDLMRALMQEWLSEAGYRVRAGPPGRTIDLGKAALVIISVYMPKHSGPQLVREIQAAHPGTPLIAISGQFRAGLSTVGATAQTLGVQQVIAKPFTCIELLAAVRAIIGPPAGLAH